MRRGDPCLARCCRDFLPTIDCFSTLRFDRNDAVGVVSGMGALASFFIDASLPSSRGAFLRRGDPCLARYCRDFLPTIDCFSTLRFDRNDAVGVVSGMGALAPLFIDASLPYREALFRAVAIQVWHDVAEFFCQV